jgi:hypothetical protein
MPSALSVGDIKVALTQRLFPAITTRNRLEARPRSQTFDRALRAEVRDALWMLTKQWQMGEFRGHDAGSPVFAKLLFGTTRITKYRPATGAAQLLDPATPLETKVERRPVPMTRQKRIISLDLRLVMARQWFALLASVGNYRDGFVTAYPINVPDPMQPQNVDICSHPEAWDTFQAFAGRAMDGGALLEYLLADTATHHAYDGVAGIDPLDHHKIDDRANRFMAWAKRFLAQPDSDQDDAWVPDHLDYQFAVSAPMPDGTEKVYVADDYASNRLDWYSLDLDPTITTLGDVPNSGSTGLPPDAPFTTIPIPVSFSGMPNTRWWAFEDHGTNFGDIDASTTDLAKLLFMEFALVYSNDWFVIPCTFPSSVLAQVRGLAVTNVFGERLWIGPADKGVETDWGRWSMFTVDIRNAPAASGVDPTLVLLPTLTNAVISPPMEDVFLVRDEVANMAWGVEATVALASGISRPGREVAIQTFNYLQGLIPPGSTPPPMAAPVRYQAMNSVPENWIPFIPAHLPNNNREIQLQRAAMPRMLAGDPNTPQKVQPQTSLLRQGLDLTSALQYFVHEEEVPRAGTRLSQYYSRARWTQGQVFTWLRARKQTGRGEATSGLAFDRLVDKDGTPS